MSLNGSTPLKVSKIKDKKIVQPEFSVTTSENIHLIFDDTWSVELSHGCLSSDDVWDIKGELVNTLLEVYEYNIRQNLESVPTTVNNNLTAVPDLTWVSHPWLWKLMLINFWLWPSLFFSIEYKDIIYDSLLTITFSSSKSDKILSKLSRWVTVSGGWGLERRLSWVNLNQIPRILMEVSMLLLLIAAILCTIFTLDRWLTRYKRIAHI